VAEPHGAAEHLDQVEVAVGMERVAGVVAGDRHGDALGRHLQDRRDPADPRAAAGPAVLQKLVAQR
jgi:hypothetical protein